ncbi:MAG: hypothetical protein FMNOHCHN_03686 [Ignavibacteriaceae bacterium]|nr:hypothetical protein [Ignavibacteriaceae bacterium]
MKVLRFAILTIYLTGVLNIPVLAHYCAMEESFSLQECAMCSEPEEITCCSESGESPVKEKFESSLLECCSTEITDSNLDNQIAVSQKNFITSELSAVALLSEIPGKVILSYSSCDSDTSPPDRGIPIYLFHNILLI